MTCCICLMICSKISIGIIIDPLLKILICTVIPNSIFYICFRNKEEFKMLENKIKIVLNLSLKFVIKK